MKFNDCFDVIGHLLADLNLNLEDDVDICLTTDADEDGCHSPSLTIVDIETRESLLTVDLREAVKGIMSGELSYPQVVFAVFSKVCAILEGDDDEADDGKESSKEVCSNASASACPDAEYGLTKLSAAQAPSDFFKSGGDSGIFLLVLDVFFYCFNRCSTGA